MKQPLAAIICGIAFVGYAALVPPAGASPIGSQGAIGQQLIAPTLVSALPRLGDRCIGAEIGRRSVDAGGNRIVCDNYLWRLDRGQEPRHRWVDDQAAWADCIQHHSTAECRNLLNH